MPWFASELFDKMQAQMLSTQMKMAKLQVAFSMKSVEPSENEAKNFEKLELVELRGIEMDELSPREAWRILEDLKKNYGKDS